MPKSPRSRLAAVLLTTLISLSPLGCGGSLNDDQVSGQVGPPESYGIGSSDPDALLSVFQDGTSFLFPQLLTSDDPSSFEAVTSQGRGMRQLYDRRSNSFVQLDTYLFEATYSDGSPIEVQLNPEFGSEVAAQEQAEFYARLVGQLPVVSRSKVEKLWIHQGDADFGGGNRSLLIHTGRTPSYQALGVLEEILLHESAHTSLDWSENSLISEALWKEAQAADGVSISAYAFQEPEREDVAESFVAYLAQRFGSDRIPEETLAKVRDGIPHRVAFFDRLNLNLSPMK